MNPDHNEEIFVVNTTTGAFTQLTDTTNRNNYAPVLDGAGSSVVFVSGGFTFDFMRLDIATGSLTQVTHLNLPAVGEYSMSASGTVLVFQVYVDLTGGNPDQGWEFFFMDVPTGQISQLADTPPEFTTLQASIDAAGTHIAFISDADLAGGNGDSGSELFLATCEGVDMTAPVIIGMPPADCTLWPPNGKLVKVATVTNRRAVGYRSWLVHRIWQQ